MECRDSNWVCPVLATCKSNTLPLCYHSGSHVHTVLYTFSKTLSYSKYTHYLMHSDSHVSSLPLNFSKVILEASELDLCPQVQTNPLLPCYKPQVNK